jgi:ketose-bisphosphate aldolase
MPNDRRIRSMIAAARSGGYALGYFESWNLESLQGTLDAAEQTRSPIIIGFNGEFMSEPGRAVRERLDLYAATAHAACESATVPCASIFNECPRDEWVRRAATLGFDIVMPADPHAPYEQYVERVAAIVRHAHAQGAIVEAELGELPCGASGVVEQSAGDDATTDPAVAEDFVARTGVDLLAVSVGNVHIMVKGEQPLDLDRLAAIRERVPDTPLVLHGGTGIEAGSLKQAIGLGVVKVNYGTFLKQRYLAAVRRALAHDEVNPHKLLGIGGERDVMTAGRTAVRDAVLERIGLLGCTGRAPS